MPRCPRCCKEISYIEEINVAKKVVKIYSSKNLISSYSESVLYRCPLCKSTLFNSKERAIRFLKGHT